MVNKTAQELGKKGGQAKSASKALAARQNASKPRKPKPMPEFDSLQMLKLVYVELLTNRGLDISINEGKGGLRINGHHIADVLLHHIETVYPESAEWVAQMRRAV